MLSTILFASGMMILVFFNVLGGLAILLPSAILGSKAMTLKKLGRQT